MDTNGTLIQPLALPSGSGIEYNGGDVRHTLPTGGLDAASISNTTRELAFRDTMIAERVNELIAAVNNREVLSNLCTPRVTLGAGQTILAANCRIPNGFQSRVVNATVAATVAGAVQLSVEYNQSTYGAADGSVSVLTTTSELTDPTSTYGQGEFILRLTNLTRFAVEVSASVLTAVRPAASSGSINAGILGEKGEPGRKGDPGDKGDPGAPGAPGVPGLRWRGVWSALTTYAVNDVVTFDWSGTIGQISYVARAAGINQTPPLPPATSTYWDVFITSTRGAPGPQGPQGLYYAGIYSNTGTYQVGAVVTTTGTAPQSFVANASNIGTPPPSSVWDRLFGTFAGPAFERRTSDVTVDTLAGYTSPSAYDIAQGYDDPALGWAIDEYTTSGGSAATSSSSTLLGVARLCWAGQIRLSMPTGVFVSNWNTTTNAKVSVAANGTTFPTLPYILPDTGTSVLVCVNGTTPVRSIVTIQGVSLGNYSGGVAPAPVDTAGGRAYAWLTWSRTRGIIASYNIASVVPSPSVTHGQLVTFSTPLGSDGYTVTAYYTTVSNGAESLRDIDKLGTSFTLHPVVIQSVGPVEFDTIDLVVYA